MHMSVFTILDRTRSGFSLAVHLVPPASTWSRLRRSSNPVQLPLRSRAEPLGSSARSHSCSECAQVQQPKLEVVSWGAEVAFLCRVLAVGVVLTFLEDLVGRHLQKAFVTVDTERVPCTRRRL